MRVQAGREAVVGGPADQGLGLRQQRGVGEPGQLGPQQLRTARLVVGRGGIVDRVVVPDGQLDRVRLHDGAAQLAQVRQHGVHMRLGMVGPVRLGVAGAQTGEAAAEGIEHARQPRA